MPKDTVEICCALALLASLSIVQIWGYITFLAGLYIACMGLEQHHFLNRRPEAQGTVRPDFTGILRTSRVGYGIVRLNQPMPVERVQGRWTSPPLPTTGRGRGQAPEYRGKKRKTRRELFLERDSEIHQTKKGTQRHFGMIAHTLRQTQGGRFLYGLIAQPILVWCTI